MASAVRRSWFGSVEAEGSRRGPGFRRWILKGFALFATAVMILVVFSYNVGPAGSASGTVGEAFEEQARRLTVAEGSSESPKIVLDASGVLHVAWIDGRGASPAVYYKSTRNGGFTFTGDRALTSAFRSVSDVSLAADAGMRTVGVAWRGAVGPDSGSVYLRASGDGGPTSTGTARPRARCGSSP